MRALLVAALLAAATRPAPAMPQIGPHDTAQPAGVPPEPGKGVLHLSAVLAGDLSPLQAGMRWTVLDARAEADGTHHVVAQASEAQPAFTLPDGDYVIHLAYGYASQMKRVLVADNVSSERMTLTAGALQIEGRLGDEIITPERLSISVYVPEHDNPQAKLVVGNAKPDQILRLPEGMYHIVSTYLDTVGVGSLTPVSNTNSVVNADLRVQSGKLVTATVKHRAAVLTLKLVNAPGGDVVRELIGAFPSLVLAEGDYILIARHGGKTYQTDFKVESGVDRDVEVPTQQHG